MSRYWTIWLVAIGLLLSLSAVAVAQGRSVPSNEFRFIGFTNDDDVVGDPTNPVFYIGSTEGMIAMHALCQVLFGTCVRMCISYDFWKSPNAEAPLIFGAWLHPIGLGVGDQSGRSADFSGITSDSDLTALSCEGWSNTSNFGLVVTTAGKAAAALCQTSTLLPVTCCAPIQ